MHNEVYQPMRRAGSNQMITDSLWDVDLVLLAPFLEGARDVLYLRVGGVT